MIIVESKDEPYIQLDKVFIRKDMWEDFKQVVIETHTIGYEKGFDNVRDNRIANYVILNAIGDYIDSINKKPNLRGKYEMKNEAKYCGRCGKKFFRGETVSLEPYPCHPTLLANGECLIDPND